ncbi:HDIG domain-containing protein [Candidatus Bathyarchaeota archaeon]|nr:HDIG domain-containing protein [Candidatus Bathyarchaeota archaeon]
MNRNDALALVKDYLKNTKLIKHVLAVEAIMEKLADYYSEDKELWGRTGLLHDIDYELIQGDMTKHTLSVESILSDKVDNTLIRAIKAHNYEQSGVNPNSVMEKSLISADTVSGLIIACAHVMPSKKLEEVTVGTISKKFQDRSFARGSERERIVVCESIGLSNEKLFKIALEALKGIGDDLGL